MTFYHEQVMQIREQNFSRDYQINQVVQAKQFIDNNYSNRIGLKDMSGVSFFSPCHFTRLFKKYYGKTACQYLTEVRIARAKQLLRSGHTSVETCYSVGFESVTSFSTPFKKLTVSTTSNFTKKKQFSISL